MSVSKPLLRRVPLALALLLVSLGPTACVRFNYFRISHFEPVAEDKLQDLKGQLQGSETGAPGPELQHCLDQLGAPSLVGENARGIGLIYAWEDRGSWRFNVSWTWQRVVNLQFDYSSTTDDMKGVLLLFDNDLRLEAIERGGMRRLVERIDLRRRPNLVEDIHGN